jgi:hypothetical protein
MMTTTISHHTLTLTDTPTVAQRRAWWDAMWADVAEQTFVFTDLMPTSLATFLAADLLLTLIAVESSVVAAMWLHDLEREDGRVTAGWIGGWVDPAWRGPVGCAALKLGLAYFQAHGVQHMFSAIHIANRASIAMTVGRSMLGFTRVMRYPGFLPFRGVMTECVISTWRPDDVDRARQTTERRAPQIAAKVAQLCTAPAVV